MYTIRPMVKEDESFIYSSWLLGLRHGNDWFLSIDKETFFQKYKIVISMLLANAVVKIACLTEDPDVVLGYSVSTGHCLHWVFVKKSWRKLGIAKSLINLDTNRCSHLTKVGKSLKPKNWVFDPFFS